MNPFTVFFHVHADLPVLTLVSHKPVLTLVSHKPVLTLVSHKPALPPATVAPASVARSAAYAWP
eukprot:353568-Chlamydomonas_euryale.AAC.4